jgi:lactoylglutathione lyase
MHGQTHAFVLYTNDMVAKRQFYETIGLDFVEERHGEGPEHYACDLQGMILEIYPLRPGVTAKPCESVALVLFVDGFERVVAGLKAMDAKPGKVGIYLAAKGLRSVSVRDPDGLLVRLLEREAILLQ